MEGYTSDIEYPASYYRELDPDYLNFCAILAGVEPIATTEAFNYCELGCGQGLGVLVLAANYPHGEFYAVDYNPSHIAQVRAIAKEAKLDNIYFFEKSFQEMLDEPSFLPEIDFMVFHGIYTWVNDLNRDNLIELCKRNVRAGGLVYNSYNAKSGWLAGEPIQKLIWGLAKEYQGNSLKKMEKVVATLDGLKNIKQGYFKEYANSIKKRLDKMKTANKNYIVHEYLHEDWKAFYFPEVCEAMEKAKLNYLCLANPAEAFSEDLYPKELTQQLEMIEDLSNRELIKDLTFNTNFRKDIYTRGRRRGWGKEEKAAWLLKQEWILIKRTEISVFEFNLSTGKAKGNELVYRPIINALQSAILSTEQLLELININISSITQALILLYSTGVIGIYKKNESSSKAVNLNKMIVKNAFNDSGFKHIVLPNANTAISFDLVGLTFLNGFYQGYEKSKDLVDYVHKALTARKLYILKDGKQLEAEAMRSQLYQIEIEWRKNTLPVLQETGALAES